MNARNWARVLGVLGVVAMTTGCPTGWNPWPKPAEPTPKPKPTLPAFDQALQVGEHSKKVFAPGEQIQMDVRLKGRALSGSVILSVMWCDGFYASKSIDTTQMRVISHSSFPSPRECWVEVELIDMDKVQVGDASVSFKIATESVSPTPTPAPPASPSVPATPTPTAPPATPEPSLAPITPYRVF